MNRKREKANITSHNRRYTLRRPKGRLGLRKTAVGLTPFVRFYSATVWAGVNASHCPIACPNRRIPRTLYEIGFGIGNKFK